MPTKAKAKQSPVQAGDLPKLKGRPVTEWFDRLGDLDDQLRLEARRVLDGGGEALLPHLEAALDDESTAPRVLVYAANQIWRLRRYRIPAGAKGDPVSEHEAALVKEVRPRFQAVRDRLAAALEAAKDARVVPGLRHAVGALDRLLSGLEGLLRQWETPRPPPKEDEAHGPDPVEAARELVRLAKEGERGRAWKEALELALAVNPTQGREGRDAARFVVRALGQAATAAEAGVLASGAAGRQHVDQPDGVRGAAASVELLWLHRRTVLRRLDSAERDALSTWIVRQEEAEFDRRNPLEGS